MNNARRIALSLSLCSLVACNGTPSKSHTSEDVRKVSSKPSESPTGAVTEEEFKAMHVLRESAAPELHGTMIDIGGTQAYLALPPGAKVPLPAIVVIHEWWGLNDHVKHWADRLASDGYAAVAVDLYGGVVATTPDQAMSAMKSVDKDRSLQTMLAAYRFLAEDPRIQARHRASIGWCFGGGKSLQLALHAPELDAAVMYYGQPVMDAKTLASLHAPLLGIFASRDQSFTPAIVKEFDEALTAAGKQHTILSYDAEHAFANPSSGRYDERSAGEAWEHVRAFLAENLKDAR